MRCARRSRRGAVLPVYRSASLAAAIAFRLHDRGLIAPGRRADIVLLDELESVAVSGVVAAGQVVEADLFEERSHPAPVGYDLVRLAPVDDSTFAIPAPAGEMDVIGVVPLSVITEHRREVPPVATGWWRGSGRVLAPGRGAGAAWQNGNIGRGLVHGFGPMHGAIATSIGHDSHNVTVVGSDPATWRSRSTGSSRCRGVPWWCRTGRSWRTWRCRWRA